MIESIVVYNADNHYIAQSIMKLVKQITVFFELDSTLDEKKCVFVRVLINNVSMSI